MRERDRDRDRGERERGDVVGERDVLVVTCDRNMSTSFRSVMALLRRDNTNASFNAVSGQDILI